MKKIFPLYKIGLGLILLGAMFINSCTPTDQIVEDLSIKLTAGTWHFSSLDAGDQTTSDFYQAIYNGDILTFNSDGTCTGKQLGTIDGSGTWVLNGNQTELTLSITYGSDDRNELWKIKTISDSELIYTFEVSPNTIEMRYTH